MSEVSRELVKLFFEMNGFLVQQDDYLYVVSQRPSQDMVRPGFVLQSDNISSIPAAIVSVRAWHSRVFWPSRLEGEGHLFDFVEEENLKKAESFFGHRRFKKVLVLSKLPRAGEMRERSLRMLEAEGVDHIFEFSAILSYLTREVDPERRYMHSVPLELLRLLKAYGFLREPQMELFEEELES